MPLTLTIPDDAVPSLLEELAALRSRIDATQANSASVVASKALPRGLAAIQEDLRRQYPATLTSTRPTSPLPSRARVRVPSTPFNALNRTDLSALYEASPCTHCGSHRQNTPLPPSLPPSSSASFTINTLSPNSSVLGKRSSPDLDSDPATRDHDPDAPIQLDLLPSSSNSPIQQTNSPASLNTPPDASYSDKSPTTDAPVPEVSEPPEKRRRVVLLVRSSSNRLLRPEDALESSGSGEEWDSESDSSSGESPASENSVSEEEKTAQKPCARQKIGNHRNGNGPRIGNAADIGYVGQGDTSAGGKRGVPGKKGTMKDWKKDGDGPPVTAGAGRLLNTLLTVFTAANQESLLDLLNRLREPSSSMAGVLPAGHGMQAILDRLQVYESQRRVIDFNQMCDLMQLALNVNSLYKEAADAGKRRPGFRKIANKYTRGKTQFHVWVTAGFRLLHMCGAGTLFLLPILACLDLRTQLMQAPAKSDIVRDIDSICQALREVSERKWGPLVKCLMGPINYIQSQKIPLLQEYRFHRGTDSFGFADIEEADRILDTVETNLFRLPARSPAWKDPASEPFACPPPTPLADLDKVIKFTTPLVLPQTTTCPFKKEEGKAWTETQRNLASQAAPAHTVQEFKSKIQELHKTGKSTPGQYLRLNPNILQGNAMTIRDSTGQMISSMIPMPEDLTKRLETAFRNLNSILPGELKAENSRRKGYTYCSLRFVWYYRMAERGDGSPEDVHPNKVYKTDCKVNFGQRGPYASQESLEHSMEYEALVEVFGEAMEFQRANFEHIPPSEYNEVSIFCDVLPLNALAPAYPFSGFALNLRVATDGHRDPLDKKFCLIIGFTDCEGGELCLFELGLVVELRTGVVFIFPSCYVTHFNLHFKGLRATLVLHSDKHGDKWAADGGGWGKRVARHYARE